MSIDKHSSRIWRARIREILNRDWDPIGGCPEDEYDDYVGKIAAMIRDNATADELLAYLEWAEAEHMGLSQFNRARGQKVVAVLMDLGPPPNSN